MKNENKVIKVNLNGQRPTTLTFNDLYTWTIWQFPSKGKGGLRGAVHPPIASHTWYPAIIKAKEKKVLVHAHLDQTFPSPEAAADYLEK